MRMIQLRSFAAFVLWILTFATAFAASPAIAQVCSPRGGDLRINAIGDILVHEALFRHAVSQRDRFLGLWRDLVPTLRDADFTYGNLEGAVAPGTLQGGREARDPGFVYDGQVYSGTNFLFNYHPYLLDDLRESGFDILSTSNNHSLDRGARGVDLTIEEISRRGLLWTGTRHRSSNQEALFTSSTIRGYPVAWIGCTEATNGIPDKHRQVQLCGGDGVTRLVRRLAQEGRFAAIIVTPHWGAEYQTAASSGQIRLAKAWAAAGATLILGNHPHVLQPLQWLDNGLGGKTLVSYSLGNFVAGQAALERRTSAILHVDLARQNDGSLRVSQVSFTPFYRLPPPAQTLRRLETFSKPPAGAADYIRRVLGAPSCL